MSAKKTRKPYFKSAVMKAAVQLRAATVHSARATSFATLRDLRGYINCLLRGGSESGCYNYGDNGTGSWGDVTAQLQTPMCALPPAEMTKQWGSSVKARGKKVLVMFNFGGMMRTVVCECRDKGPSGVVDLNPAALQQAGLSSDTELNVPATWQWIV